MDPSRDRLELLHDPAFIALARARDRVSSWLTAAMLAVYFGFIFLIAFGREVFGWKVSENVPLGIPLGIGVIVVSWMLTGVYVRWANRRYDAAVAEIRRKAGA